MKKFSVRDDFTDFYRENGFVILTDVFEEGELSQVREDIHALWETRFEGIANGNLAGDEIITEYYESHGSEWGECASEMWNLPSVMRLGPKETVLEAVRKTGIEQPIATSRPQVRVDMPEDSEYRIPWHQDWRFGQGSLNSVTMWIPHHDVAAENGAIDVKPRTHTLGYLDVVQKENPRRFIIESDEIHDYGESTMELDLGEVVLFSQFLAHQSGYNSTDQPRITTQIRYSDFAEPRFVEEGFPSPDSSETDIVWEQPPTREELEEILS